MKVTKNASLKSLKTVSIAYHNWCSSFLNSSRPKNKTRLNINQRFRVSNLRFSEISIGLHESHVCFIIMCVIIKKVRRNHELFQWHVANQTPHFENLKTNYLVNSIYFVYSQIDSPWEFYDTRCRRENVNCFIMCVSQLLLLVPKRLHMNVVYMCSTNFVCRTLLCTTHTKILTLLSIL